MLMPQNYIVHDICRIYNVKSIIPQSLRVEEGKGIALLLALLSMKVTIYTLRNVQK